MTKLDAATRELLIEALIIGACSAAPQSLKLALFQIHARRMGHSVDQERLLAEIEYLVEKGLLQPATKELVPAVREWKITAKGRDYAEEKGLTE